MELARTKTGRPLETGAIVNVFCGPCFGAGDTPANNAFSIRHSTRNFPNREDPRSRTARFFRCPDGCTFHCSNRSKQGIPDCRAQEASSPNIHETGIPLRQEDLREPCLRAARVADLSVEIQFGPNIKDWLPAMQFAENLILKVVSRSTIRYDNR